MTTPAPGFIESAIKYWHVASNETGDARETSDQLYQAIQALPADAVICSRALLLEAAEIVRAAGIQSPSRSNADYAYGLTARLEQAAATKGEQT